MGNIKLLDENTINKIAAGEVVENPCSVVKELCENAIDAGATAISVEIKDGGISYIRVTDNGTGIDKDSIKTAFMRHATSKITSIEDLLSVRSLGFRGEALSSIAAVSQVELLTKRRSDICGIRYRIEGGKELSFDEAGLPDGTTFVIRNLFFNTPARRKFLKSPLTEGNQITELMERMILSHPDISFKFLSGGREKLVSAGLGEIKSNAYSVFGRDITRNLIDVEFENENIRITGFAGKPEIGRGNRNYEVFFVNNRYIKSNVLSKAVEEAYKPYLMLHKFPFVLYYIDISSKDIDVNVHPAKTEIRFLQEEKVYETVKDVTLNAISHKELIPEVTVTTQDVILNKPIAAKEESVYTYTPEPFETKKLEEFKQAAKESEEKISDIIESVKKEEFTQETLFSEGILEEKDIVKYRIIGQVFDTYWIVEYEKSMYIIDQHAAHEKVIYERLKRQIDNNNVISQLLMPSCIVTLTESEAEVLNANMDSFKSLGFDVESFGGSDYAISAVPCELFSLSPRDYFTVVLDDLCEYRKQKSPDNINDRIATMACKAAVKGNMKMSFAEAEELIKELLSLNNPYNCPHGRPTIISYSQNELEKLFKRIV